MPENGRKGAKYAKSIFVTCNTRKNLQREGMQ